MSTCQYKYQRGDKRGLMCNNKCEKLYCKNHSKEIMIINKMYIRLYNQQNKETDSYKQIEIQKNMNDIKELRKLILN